MKRELFILSTFLLVFTNAFGQVSDTIVTDMSLKNRILEEIQVGFDNKAKQLDSAVIMLDEKVNSLDLAIAASKNASDKADILLERVQAIEKRQMTVDENEVNVYQANYQSAIINLVSMDSDIKPLILFNSTQSFFNSLGTIGNPMSYKGYREWFKTFNEFIEAQKEKEVELNVLSSLMSLTGDLAGVVPLSGPITEPLFKGMSIYINSLNKNKNKKKLRSESEDMFLLTAKISQFNYDKNLIESEWGSITKELEELQKQFDHILIQNLNLLNIDEGVLKSMFTEEINSEKKYNYSTFLRQKSADIVLDQKVNNPKEWKELIYFQLMDIQALKLNFGHLTFKISENLNKYATLISKYKSDPQIGGEVFKLDSKLTQLRETFDSTFRPMEYINSATRMYKII